MPNVGDVLLGVFLQPLFHLLLPGHPVLPILLIKEQLQERLVSDCKQNQRFA